MIRGVLAALVLASPVQAGDWELFEKRCLAPLEDVELRQPHDLEPSARFKNDGDTYSEYSFADQTVLYVSDGRSGQAQWCALMEIEQGAIDQALTWAQTAIEVGRYVNVTSNVTSAAITLQSTEWREPRIEVSIQVLGNSDGPSLAVKETDLES